MPLIGTVSGSHTHLKEGGSFLKAGSNVTITSSSVGGEFQVSIASSGGSTNAAGSDTQVQFNDGGTNFGGDSGMTYNKSTNTLSVDNIVPAAVIADSSTTPVVITRGSQSNIFGGTNAVLFVSGTSTSLGSFDNGSPRAAVFGGDIVASGTIRGGNPAFMQGGSLLDLRAGTVTISHRAIPFGSANGGPGFDVSFFVSGAIGDRQISGDKTGTSAFGGDLVVSGATFLGQGLQKLTDTALTVEGNSNGSFVVLIDNDQSTAGHGLKVTSDGTGTDTNVFDVEVGSTTHMRVRGDGRIGMGKVTALPQAKLTIDGSGVGGDSADLSIAGKIMHLGDSNTHLTFPENDAVQLTGGGISLFEGYAAGGQGNVLILSGGSGNSEDASEYQDTSFFVSGSVMSRGTTGGGTALFGGDLVLSGVLHITGSGEDAGVAQKSSIFIGSGGRPVTGAPATISMSSSGVTISAAIIVGTNGMMAMSRSSGQSDTFDTAANIIAQIPLASAGLQIDFTYMNLSSNTVTLAAPGDNSIIMANQNPMSYSISAGTGRNFRLAINSGMNSITILPVSSNYNLNS